MLWRLHCMRAKLDLLVGGVSKVVSDVPSLCWLRPFPIEREAVSTSDRGFAKARRSQRAAAALTG